MEKDEICIDENYRRKIRGFFKYSKNINEY